MLHSILGGAALQRCIPGVFSPTALAAEGRCRVERDFFRSLLDDVGELLSASPQGRQWSRNDSDQGFRAR
jgi:hypothetical protein